MTFTVQQALREAIQQLHDYVDDPYTDCHVLMSHCLHQNRAWLIAHADDVLGESEHHAFKRLVDARQRGTPVAHLTGSREFWSMSFEVTPDTLIPRPETEHLIERSLALPLPTSDISVLDFGTGSGIIAITLAKERPDWALTAIDSSADALKIARKNAVTNAATIDFVESNDLRPFTGRVFDVIVSNPPYIAESDPHLKQGDVRFEPPSALSSGSDGLDCIRYLVTESPHYLKPSGYLVLEHGYDQGKAVRDLLDRRGYTEIKTDKDLSGQDRISSAQWVG
jgi:release factor glutamine methyltransferase